jgi:hypothetical protein
MRDQAAVCLHITNRRSQQQFKYCKACGTVGSPIIRIRTALATICSQMCTLQFGCTTAKEAGPISR